MSKGLFITVEGGEGAGKTTTLDRLEEELVGRGYDVLRTREPGGIRIAEQIREVLLNTAHTEMDGRTEALLYAAARRQHLVEKVLPAIEAGQVVLCDRFIDSSLAYQGYARGIGVDAIQSINDFAIDGCMPQLTLFFDVDPNIGLQRIAANQERENNRLDQEKKSFHDRVRRGYELLLEQYPDRIKKINANEDVETVYRMALAEVETLLKE
ncbi:MULTISPECIES: dTMP kinase [Halalkalibacter]|uniref:Thymidylate kinase n=1 Tax=Halalkalibacter hemicellulosilyticusJCM 9152 TaxID=1236971 RepID=W4QHW5_9BACI|nr:MULTISPECIES: dTMP kinase [Halalkalibacter]MCK0473602.1 dTMP kinase [Halalkalibacter sp. APA_J-10(15)]GAE31720.1 thymidylate kinase [Halalkalibacter hemicellulosilyticusJCM 9152]